LDWWESWRAGIIERALEWTYHRDGSAEQWQPRISRFVEELGPVIESALAVSLALVEFRREDLPAHLSWLDRLASAVRSNGGAPLAIEEACRDVANAGLLQAMAGAFALGAWPSLGMLLSWPDVAGPGRVGALSSGFTYYRFFESNSIPLAHAHRALLAQSDVWAIATRDRTPPLQYLLWVGIVLAVQAEATAADSGATATWTLLWSPQSQAIETLLRLIGHHDELADVLAAACGDASGSVYRSEFPGRYIAAARRRNGRSAFIASDPLDEREVRRYIGLPRETS